jgi:hypothetical protein
MYCFDPTGNTWSAISSSGNIPSGRIGAGFASAPDGTFYLFGGLSYGENSPIQALFDKSGN